MKRKYTAVGWTNFILMAREHFEKLTNIRVKNVLTSRQEQRKIPQQISHG